MATKTSELEKLVFDFEENEDANIEKINLSFEVVSESTKSDSERNARIWLFIKESASKAVSLHDYICINSHISFVYKDGTSLNIDGCIDCIRPQDNNTVLLILNCLYAPDTLEYIE